ncbi:hypothetical protein SAMN05444171_1485 [Bradyrhizobium lablabi]|uniref:Uncharacterized protein n=2 Tax=Bradyrhizobium TaxID=374 RepID=A0ABY0Q5N5_9BRAD|nr:hypothetical protein SAMN05444163_5674 [Bradyrhizobium ottawaense]SEC46823.1 hypothetical protein SAMN05444171_1485 [Bradyrhizobium lablabi]
MDRSSYEGLDRPTTPPVLTRSNRLISAEHHRTSIVQQRGRGHGRGTPAWTMWPIARSMPAFRQGQPRTNKRKCGTQPANQSLITDVFRSRPHPCTIYRPDPQARMAVRGRSIARSALDEGHQSLLTPSRHRRGQGNPSCSATTLLVLSLNQVPKFPKARHRKGPHTFHRAALLWSNRHGV